MIIVTCTMPLVRVLVRMMGTALLLPQNVEASSQSYLRLHKT